MNDKIFLKDIVADTYTNASGLTLFVCLKNYIESKNEIHLSFKDSTPVSSSFLNSSIGELIIVYGFDKLKTYIKITDLTASQATILRNYLKSCGVQV